MTDQIINNITEKGFAIFSFPDHNEVEQAEQELLDINAFDFGEMNAITNLLQLESIRNLINGTWLTVLISRLSTKKIYPIKAFILEKTLANNWEIPWHQDLKIAVQQKILIDGYRNWSAPAGIIHVEPPLHILKQLLTLRVHLDACDEHNGAISVIPGSHRNGILSAKDILEILNREQSHCCIMQKYEMMLMKPLLLHNSPPSRSPNSRRILQIEFGCDLEEGMQWHGV